MAKNRDLRGELIRIFGLRPLATANDEHNLNQAMDMILELVKGCINFDCSDCTLIECPIESGEKDPIGICELVCSEVERRISNLVKGANDGEDS